jgi:hypothetical protein
VKNLDGVVMIQALRQQGESLVRTQEPRTVHHQVGDYAVIKGDLADHFQLYVTQISSGRRVPQSGQNTIEAAKRHADACAVVLAGVVLPVSPERGVELMRTIRSVAAKSDDTRLTTKVG